MASAAQHKEIKSALERYTKEELIDLMEHLLRIYVLNEPVKLDTNISKPETLKDLAGCTFTQLLSQLQTSLEMDELGKFRITPYTVYVSIGEAEFDLNGPTPTLAAEHQSDPPAEDDENLSPAERMDAVDSKPWRRAPQPAPAAPASHTETPSMADLFANDRERGFALFEEPPERVIDEELPPPIAETAPGDDPQVTPQNAPSDFAKTAASREEAPQAIQQPPQLAEGDKQIDPSNRFASLDLD